MLLGLLGAGVGKAGEWVGSRRLLVALLLLARGGNGGASKLAGGDGGCGLGLVALAGRGGGAAQFC